MSHEQEIAALHAQVKALTERLGKVESHHLTITHLQREHMDWMTENQGNIWDRIKNLETSVFPQLTGDLGQVQKIIGDGDGKGDNPLDRRGR